MTIGRRIPSENYSSSKAIAAVIVTFHTGSCYDSMFQSVPQAAPSEDTCVSVLEFEYTDMFTIEKALSGNRDAESQGMVKELLRDISKCSDAGSVLFNFECCSHADTIQDKSLMQFTMAMVKRGYTVQFGDFSTKALIRTWDESTMGKKLLAQTGSCSGVIQLEFDPETLMNCESSQLQTVGNLCSGEEQEEAEEGKEETTQKKKYQKGSCSIHAMGGTVVFALSDPSTLENSQFTAQIFTTTTNATTPPQQSYNYNSYYPQPFASNSNVNQNPYTSSMGNMWNNLKNFAPSFSQQPQQQQQQQFQQPPAGSPMVTEEDPMTIVDEEQQQEEGNVGAMPPAPASPPMPKKTERDTNNKSIGHMILRSKLKNGGKIMISAGHWIELSSINGVTEEAALKWATKTKGEDYSRQLRAQWANASSLGEREGLVQQYCQQSVQCAAPNQYSSLPAMNAFKTFSS